MTARSWRASRLSASWAEDAWLQWGHDLLVMESRKAEVQFPLAVVALDAAWRTTVSGPALAALVCRHPPKGRRHKIEVAVQIVPCAGLTAVQAQVLRHPESRVRSGSTRHGSERGIERGMLAPVPCRCCIGRSLRRGRVGSGAFRRRGREMSTVDPAATSLRGVELQPPRPATRRRPARPLPPRLPCPCAAARSA